jgi:uncharacterized membrane protein
VRGTRLGLGAALGITAISLALGLTLKAPCADLDDWADGRAARLGCYSDIVALYAGRSLDEGVPYLDRPFEYPVGTGIPVMAASALANSSTSFFLLNVAILAAAGLVTSWALHRTVGDRVLYFAAAPTLVLTAFTNWDLLAVALTTLGMVALVADRSLPSGVWIGLGTAAKAYPALVGAVFALDRWRHDRRDAIRLVAAAAVAWIVVNAPIAAVSPQRWSFFYRFSASREPTIESLWSLACRATGGDGATCWPGRLVTIVGTLALVGGSVLVWRLRWRRDPTFPLWTLAFPVLVLFLLTSKVYSPQFALWLLPWFALTLPDLRPFIAFQAIEVVTFLARIGYQRTTLDLDGVPRWVFEMASGARSALFVVLIVAWVRRPPDRTSGQTIAAAS